MFTLAQNRPPSLLNGNEGEATFNRGDRWKEAEQFHYSHTNIYSFTCRKGTLESIMIEISGWNNQ